MRTAASGGPRPLRRRLREGPPMPITEEERAEVRRRNGAKSRGPVTDAGKERSRQNAMKHGLSARVLALPDEDPEAIAARQHAWDDFYRPDSPATRHLVHECVRATLLADRCHAHHDQAVAKQVREAQEAWLRRREDELE